MLCDRCKQEADNGPRSRESHNHQFAEITNAWRHLPEALAEDFPTSEHLRKFCLIRTGYRNERHLPMESREEALRVAAFLRPVDPYAIIIVCDSVVTEYTAQSQSMRAMGKKRFNESKSAVLDYIARMVGVSADEFRDNLERAA